MIITKNTPIEMLLALGKECAMCGHCCEYGSGIMTENDISRLSKHLNLSREELMNSFLEPITKFNTTLHKPKLDKKPFGQCIFYIGSKGCKIHNAKPLNCRLANCKEHGEDINLWFTLKHFVNPEDSTSIREYAYYLKAGGKTLPGFSLKELVKDQNKLKKILEIGGLK